MTGPHKPRPLAAQIIDLAERGLHVAEIARRTGYSPRGVKLLLDRNNVVPGKCSGTVSRPRNAERGERMEVMYRQGITLEKIGQHFGITRERVRQVLKRMGVTSCEGGQAKTAQYKQAAVKSVRDAESLTRWGITYEEKKKRRADGTLGAYINQRNAAKCRAIHWSIPFQQWLSIWEQSGKLALRGRGKGRYVMSRIKDEGGYVIGNVHIQLSTDNNRQGLEKCRHNKAKTPGVWLIYPGLARPWIAKCGKTALGRFGTQEEAAAARAEYLAMHPHSRARSGRGYAVINGKVPRFQVMLGRKYIGTYGTPEAAIAARQSALAQPLA